jgi:hypothetical protein
VWHFDPERRRGGEIDDKIEFGRLLTGRSPGLAPRKILSTYSAARRNKAGSFGPECLLRLPGPILYPFRMADTRGSADPCSARGLSARIWLRTRVLGRLRVWMAIRAPNRLDSLGGAS